MSPSYLHYKTTSTNKWLMSGLLSDLESGERNSSMIFFPFFMGKRKWIYVSADINVFFCTSCTINVVLQDVMAIVNFWRLLLDRWSFMGSWQKILQCEICWQWWVHSANYGPFEWWCVARGNFSWGIQLFTWLQWVFLLPISELWEKLVLI